MDPHTALFNSFNQFGQLSLVAQDQVLQFKFKTIIEYSMLFQQSSGMNSSISAVTEMIDRIIKDFMSHWLLVVLPEYITKQCEIGPFSRNDYMRFSL
jgi:hypothetical protein